MGTERFITCIAERKVPAVTLEPLVILLMLSENVCLWFFTYREGVQFMFECVSGLSSTPGIAGCILADDMGYALNVCPFTIMFIFVC